ncbi:MAG: galactosyldiacylglycerol synthase [Sulfobacillus thermosulfidooxidans]|uniref:Galactosyldiacylglycerol synthase n=1 Tax=Sulfobacillus thermosulfidooxidans TaxID=28034 RepID=A0A2T2WPY3_SULTH|nr:MAG: galactosyldiacylglycerol synthase [Sulfobacillus thermosulfidooxidans]
MDMVPASGTDVKQSADWIDWLANHHDATLSLHPEIMILAARYGDGHLRAAKAIALQLLMMDSQLRLGILDYYRFVNPGLDNLIRWGYLTSVRRAPSLWRWFYTSTQNIDPLSRTQRLINHIGIKRFYSALKDMPPKLIVSTYPTAAGVVSTLKQQGKLDAINYVVMTDYSVHTQWIHPAVDMYFVGSEDMRQELLDRHIDSSKIIVSGIPVDERFQETVDEHAVRQSLHIDDNLPIILFMGGAYMPIAEYVQVLKILDHVPAKHTTIVIAGHEELRLTLAKQYEQQARNPMVVLGYVNNVHELMAISSLLISKAGGLTTTESLCRGLPTVIYRPIPGQEDANAEFLVRNGAGRRAHTEEDLGEIVTHLLEHPWELKAMAHQARSLGHPDAAQIVAKHIYLALRTEEANAPA